MAEGGELETNKEAHGQLAGRLRKLWQSDPASYWKEFKASGLEAKDVWVDAFDYTSSEEGKKAMAKPPSRK